MDIDFKAFWKSKTLWGILIALVPTLCQLAGIPLPIAENLTNILVLAGGTLAGYGRVSATQKLSLK